MRIAAARKAEILELADHIGVRQAAARYGISPSTISRWTQKAERVLEPWQGSPGGGYPEEVRRSAVRLCQKIGFAAAARLLGISKSTLTRWWDAEAASVQGSASIERGQEVPVQPGRA